MKLTKEFLLSEDKRMQRGLRKISKKLKLISKKQNSAKLLIKKIFHIPSFELSYLQRLEKSLLLQRASINGRRSLIKKLLSEDQK